MSEPTPREALREEILTILGNHFYDAGYDGTVDDVEQLVNSEVLAVLERLEPNAWSHAIERERQRYGGKEQRE